LNSESGLTISGSIPPELDGPGERASLVNRAARSVKWAFLYNAAPRLVTPFSTIILAALLTPADFGLVAIATLVMALARILVDMGLGRAVIQRQTRIKEAASVALWCSVLVSVGLYGVLWIAAPWLSKAYNNTQVTGVIRVAALSLPLSAAASIPTALLQRNMEFRRLFWVNSSLLVVPAIVSVGLALAGAGYWAIIVGQLAGTTTNVVLAWSLVRWRPMRVFDWPLLRSMFGFSTWIMVAGFQNWLFYYAGNAIAGLFMGVQYLGVYSLGFTISILIPNFFVDALGDVAYPTFCRLQEAPKVVGHSLLKLQTLTVAVLFPVALGISAIAEPVVDLLYGDKWQGLGTVIGFLVIMPGLSYIWSLSGKAYQAVGRPDIWAKLSGVILLVLLPLLWIAAPHGLLIFTLVCFGVSWLIPLANILVGSRVLQISVREQIGAFASPLCIAAVMFALVYALTRLMSPFEGLTGWIAILLIIAMGAAVYLLLLRLTNRGLWDQLFLGLRQVVH